MEPTEQNTPKPQTVQPDTLFAPSVPTQPASDPAYSAPSSPTQPSVPETPSDSDPDAGKRRKIIIIAGIVLGSIFLILIIYVLVSSGGKKSQSTQTDQNVQTNDILTQPAAIDIENANNSISSDITGLNDANDFPTANLSDDNLEL